MYADPSKIRDRVIRVRLSEEEDDLLDAITRYTGGQKSSLMRELFIDGAKRVLAGLADVGESAPLFEGSDRASFGPR